MVINHGMIFHVVDIQWFIIINFINFAMVVFGKRKVNHWNHLAVPYFQTNPSEVRCTDTQCTSMDILAFSH